MLTPTGKADSKPIVFMGKYPEEVFTYQIPIEAVLNGGTVERIAVASAPSGLEELVISNLTVDTGLFASMTVSGGQPGRIYSFKIGLTMDTGEVRELVATLTVSRVLVSDQPTAPDSDGFSGTVRWPTGPVGVYGRNKYGDGSVYGGPF